MCSRQHCAARLRTGWGYWDHRPNTARFLIDIVKSILDFHESEPILNRE
jgi:hypothetical protein